MTARCALCMGARKFSGVPDYVLFPNFLTDFLFPIEPMNVRAKFEVRSFTRS